MKYSPFVFLFWLSIASAAQFDQGRDAVLRMTGCKLVDYSFTEDRAIMPGYVMDERVYDVNRDKTVKEWIYAEEITPTRIRLQHVLFMTDLDGTVREGTHLKHEAEDWEYADTFLYEFSEPRTWMVRSLSEFADAWTRKITYLDDGLRYQCASQWDLSTEYPNWSCDTYAPIPGRESRDMQRRDYNTLQRSTKVVVYGDHWLERQSNIKTIDANGARTPLAHELGKTWYVKLPDSECSTAIDFMQPRLEYWKVLREAWDEVLIGDRPFIEENVTGGSLSRFMEIDALEYAYRGVDLLDPAMRRSVKDAIQAIIRDYRAN